MSQIVHMMDEHGLDRIELPDADQPLVANVLWGRVDVAFTPAFWASQIWLRPRRLRTTPHRIGRTFREEVAACLLGGYGIPAEVGLAAFARLRDAGVLEGRPTADEVLRLLAEPLFLGTRAICYRFARQKAVYLSAILRDLPSTEPVSKSGIQLRNSLRRYAGIGLKTASWIARNWLSADDIAILDIHVQRAGLLMGLYSPEQRVPRDYLSMEEAFVLLASRMGVRTSDLDAVIWSEMRQHALLTRGALGQLA